MPNDNFLIFRTMKEMVAAVFFRRHWVFRSCLGAALVVLGILAVSPRQYSVSTSFIVQAPNSPGAVSALAAQFGIAAGAAEAGATPAYFVHLATSRAILGSTINALRKRRVLVPSLAEALDAQEVEEAAIRDDLLLRRLQSRITASTDQRTGVVTLSVKMPTASLAEATANDLLESIQSFNLTKRRTTARSEREFLGGRLREARDSLRSLEVKQAGFVSGNRSFAGSPTLLLAYERLQREIGVLQQIEFTLRQSFEQARLEEVRNTPVLTVVDSPVRPVRPEPRGGLLKLILSVVGAGLIALLAAITIPLTTVQNAEVGIGGFMRDLSKPWRLLGPPK